MRKLVAIPLKKTVALLLILSLAATSYPSPAAGAPIISHRPSLIAQNLISSQALAARAEVSPHFVEEPGWRIRKEVGDSLGRPGPRTLDDSAALPGIDRAGVSRDPPTISPKAMSDDALNTDQRLKNIQQATLRITSIQALGPSEGTGFVVKADNSKLYILTAAHCLGRQTSIVIKGQRSKVKADVVAIDSNNDLALLSIPTSAFKSGAHYAVASLAPRGSLANISNRDGYESYIPYPSRKRGDPERFILKPLPYFSYSWYYAHFPEYLRSEFTQYKTVEGRVETEDHLERRIQSWRRELESPRSDSNHFWTPDPGATRSGAPVVTPKGYVIGIIQEVHWQAGIDLLHEFLERSLKQPASDPDGSNVPAGRRPAGKTIHAAEVEATPKMRNEKDSGHQRNIPSESSSITSERAQKIVTMPLRSVRDAEAVSLEFFLWASDDKVLTSFEFSAVVKKLLGKDVTGALHRYWSNYLPNAWAPLHRPLFGIRDFRLLQALLTHWQFHTPEDGDATLAHFLTELASRYPTLPDGMKQSLQAGALSLAQKRKGSLAVEHAFLHLFQKRIVRYFVLEADESKSKGHSRWELLHKDFSKWLDWIKTTAEYLDTRSWWAVGYQTLGEEAAQCLVDLAHDPDLPESLGSLAESRLDDLISKGHPYTIKTLNRTLALQSIRGLSAYLHGSWASTLRLAWIQRALVRAWWREDPITMLRHPWVTLRTAALHGALRQNGHETTTGLYLLERCMDGLMDDLSTTERQFVFIEHLLRDTQLTPFLRLTVFNALARARNVAEEDTQRLRSLATALYPDADEVLKEELTNGHQIPIRSKMFANRRAQVLATAQWLTMEREMAITPPGLAFAHVARAMATASVYSHLNNAWAGCTERDPGLIFGQQLFEGMKDPKQFHFQMQAHEIMHTVLSLGYGFQYKKAVGAAGPAAFHELLADLNVDRFSLSRLIPLDAFDDMAFTDNRYQSRGHPDRSNYREGQQMEPELYVSLRAHAAGRSVRRQWRQMLGPKYEMLPARMIAAVLEGLQQGAISDQDSFGKLVHYAMTQWGSADPDHFIPKGRAASSSGLPDGPDSEVRPEGTAHENSEIPGNPENRETEDPPLDPRVQAVSEGSEGTVLGNSEFSKNQETEKRSLDLSSRRALLGSTWLGIVGLWFGLSSPGQAAIVTAAMRKARLNTPERRAERERIRHAIWEMNLANRKRPQNPGAVGAARDTLKGALQRPGRDVEIRDGLFYLFLYDPDPDVRGHALVLLGQVLLSKPELQRSFGPAFDEPSALVAALEKPALRQAAEFVLSHTGDPTGTLQFLCAAWNRAVVLRDESLAKHIFNVMRQDTFTLEHLWQALEPAPRALAQQALLQTLSERTDLAALRMNKEQAFALMLAASFPDTQRSADYLLTHIPPDSEALKRWIDTTRVKLSPGAMNESSDSRDALSLLRSLDAEPLNRRSTLATLAEAPSLKDALSIAPDQIRVLLQAPERNEQGDLMGSMALDQMLEIWQEDVRDDLRIKEGLGRPLTAADRSLFEESCARSSESSLTSSLIRALGPIYGSDPVDASDPVLRLLSAGLISREEGLAAEVPLWMERLRFENAASKARWVETLLTIRHGFEETGQVDRVRIVDSALAGISKLEDSYRWLLDHTVHPLIFEWVRARIPQTRVRPPTSEKEWNQRLERRMKAERDPAPQETVESVEAAPAGIIYLLLRAAQAVGRATGWWEIPDATVARWGWRGVIPEQAVLLAGLLAFQPLMVTAMPYFMAAHLALLGIIQAFNKRGTPISPWALLGQQGILFSYYLLAGSDLALFAPLLAMIHVLFDDEQIHGPTSAWRMIRKTFLGSKVVQPALLGLGLSLAGPLMMASEPDATGKSSESPSVRRPAGGEPGRSPSGSTMDVRRIYDSGYTYSHRLDIFHDDLIDDLMLRRPDLKTSGMTIVDFGIGSDGAPTTFDLAERLSVKGFTNVQLVGVDGDPGRVAEAIDELMSRDPVEGVNVKFMRGSFDVQLKQPADLIIVANVFAFRPHASHELERALLMRQLAKDGEFYVVTGSSGWLDVDRYDKRKGRIFSYGFRPSASRPGEIVKQPTTETPAQPGMHQEDESENLGLGPANVGAMDVGLMMRASDVPGGELLLAAGALLTLWILRGRLKPWVASIASSLRAGINASRSYLAAA